MTRASDKGRSNIRQETFGRRLRRLRTERGFRPTDLAERLGVSKVTVWKWESDKARPRSRSLERLAHVFDCDVSDLSSGAAHAGSVKSRSLDTPLGEALEVYKAEIAELAGTSTQNVAITISFGR